MHEQQSELESFFLCDRNVFVRFLRKHNCFLCLKMKRLSGAFIQGIRTVSRAESVCRVIGRGGRRMEPLFVRSFSTGSASRFERVETILRSKYARLLSFASGLGLSMGGLSYAGFMGFGSGSSNQKNVTRLMKDLEAIREKYPDIKASPVVSRYSEYS